MPAVIDPYKHIMEKLMPLDPTPLEDVHPHVNANITDDGKVQLWVKDKHHTMEPEEAMALARQLIQKATTADTEAKRRAQAQTL
jgi:hypothetical protein